MCAYVTFYEESIKPKLDALSAIDWLLVLISLMLASIKQQI